MKKGAVAGVCTAMLLAAAGCSGGTAQVDYAWSNVAIGGGGYVTGMVYSEAQEHLVYARTDIGGAYRWTQDVQRWVPLTDHLGAEQWNLIGIESIAADPVEANRVYLLCGTYMDTNGAVLASEDYGATWAQVDMPFSCGGNCSGRGVGERMMVNPQNNSEIWLGTRNAGLWKSEDYGRTWNVVAQFPVKGDYVQENNAIGIMWVEFSPENGAVYVGVAQTNGECIYRSMDGGENWEALPVFAQGLYPLQADFSTDGTLYLSYADNCGANLSNCQQGAVAKFRDGHFTDITPQCDDGRYGGFSGISVDRSHPETVVVTTMFYWSPQGDNIYRSTDGGESWTGMFNGSTGEKRYVMDVQNADWLRWGREEAKLGWWMTDININPFNSDEVMYGTGATIYTTQNMTALGSKTPVTVAFHAQGLEETAVTQLQSPQYQDEQPQLYSIMSDLTGFAHLDVTQPPDNDHFMGAVCNAAPAALDTAYQNAACAVFTVYQDASPVWFTMDGGKSWQDAGAPEHVGGGTVAMAADGSRFLWMPQGSGKVYLYDAAQAGWFYAQGLGMGAKVAADRVDPQKFYANYNGLLHISEDGGASFHSTGTLLSEDAELCTVMNKEGHLWIRSGTLLMCSEDGGSTFTKIEGTAFSAIGFGAPQKEGDEPVVYAMGSAGEQGSGIYRSTDKGASWVRLNDDKHLFGNLSPVITGDGRVYGRVYFATNGRGIVMGDIQED